MTFGPGKSPQSRSDTDSILRSLGSAISGVGPQHSPRVAYKCNSAIVCAASLLIKPDPIAELQTKLDSGQSSKTGIMRPFDALADGAVYGVAQIAGKILNFLLIPFFTFIMQKADMGVERWKGDRE